MKRFIIKLLMFLSASALLYSFMLILAGLYAPGFLKKNVQFHLVSYGHTHTRLSEADTISNVDVLVVGSSHAFRGFDTRIFEKKGYTCFNLGTANQTPIQTTFLLKKYISRLRPKLVVWDVWPNTFAIDGVESMTDLISKSGKPLEFTDMLLDANSVVGYNTFIASVIYWQFLDSRNFRESPHFGQDSYIKGGFVERKIEYHDTFERLRPGEKVFLPEQTVAFQQGLEFLKEKNITVMLVQSPCTTEHWKSFTNKDQIDNFFQHYVNRRLAAQYINYNERRELALDDSLDFYDTHHLNQNGVIKFNTELLQQPLFDDLLNPNRKLTKR